MTWVSIIALIASTAFDVVSTVMAKRRGAVESNPLLRFAGAAWIPFRLLMTAAAVALVWHYDAWAVGLIVAAVWVAVGLLNMRNARVLSGTKE